MTSVSPVNLYPVTFYDVTEMVGRRLPDEECHFTVLEDVVGENQSYNRRVQLGRFNYSHGSVESLYVNLTRPSDTQEGVPHARPPGITARVSNVGDGNAFLALSSRGWDTRAFSFMPYKLLPNSINDFSYHASSSMSEQLVSTPRREIVYCELAHEAYPAVVQTLEDFAMGCI